MELQSCRKSFTKHATRSAVFCLLAQGKIKRRTRKSSTPHAEFEFSAGEVDRLKMPNSMPNRAKLCADECLAGTFFALCQKMLLCNLLIIKCDLI